MPKKVDAATANLAGKPDNRAASYTAADEGGAASVWHRWDASVQHCTFGSRPGCAWMVQGACSCARVAASRSCCAATATVATGTVAGSAGAWRATLLGARAHADTNGLGAAGLPTLSGRGAGASAAMREVKVVMSVVVTSNTT